MEIETKAWVSFAKTSLVNDGQDENGQTLVYAFKFRRDLYQQSPKYSYGYLFLAKFVSLFGLQGMRLLLLNQVPSFVLIETGYDLKTAKLPGQCPFNRSQRPFGATKQLLGWNEHQSGRARDKVNHLHACMRVVTGCDILDLHGDPSDSMEIPRVPARWSPAWICFSLLLSSSLVFLNPVKLISIISYRDEVWHARGKAWDSLVFLFLNAFFLSRTFFAIVAVLDKATLLSLVHLRAKGH